jgi:hypothetical protein
MTFTHTPIAPPLPTLSFGIEFPMVVAVSHTYSPVDEYPSLSLPAWLSHCLVEDFHHPHSGELPTGTHLIARAFQFAYNLHQEQYRASGEPYIAHPVAVAGLLRELGGSPSMIAAGFLHDIVEDTDTTPEDLEAHFGSEVRFLVEGVTKLSKFNFSSKTEQQAENFRRMFLAMAKDIRVIVVKLADRLHNMRTLEHLAPEKQRRIAQETLDIFAPLANRLGIGRFKWELEDLSFKYLQPDAYREIALIARLGSIAFWKSCAIASRYWAFMALKPVAGLSTSMASTKKCSARTKASGKSTTLLLCASLCKTWMNATEL